MPWLDSIPGDMLSGAEPGLAAEPRVEFTGEVTIRFYGNDPGFHAAIRDAIPPRDRKWRADLGAWDIDWKHSREAVALFDAFYPGKFL